MVDKKILEQNIIKILGVEPLPEEEKARLIDKMAQLTEKRITLRLMENLSEENHQEFEKIDEEDDKAKMEFLQEKFPNLETIIQEEIIKVKEELMNEAKGIDKDLEKI